MPFVKGDDPNRWKHGRRPGTKNKSELYKQMLKIHFDIDEPRVQRFLRRAPLVDIILAKYKKKDITFEHVIHAIYVSGSFTENKEFFIKDMFDRINGKAVTNVNYEPEGIDDGIDLEKRKQIASENLRDRLDEFHQRAITEGNISNIPEAEIVKPKKKRATRKTATKKATTKRASPKKAVTKKAAPKKTKPKKTIANKSTTKKTTSNKSTPRITARQSVKPKVTRKKRR